jgi:hypothetical protein
MIHRPLIILIISLMIYAIGGLATIWSLNTLFNTGIPYSFKTWFAVVVLIFIIRYVVRRVEPFGRPHVDYFDDDEDEDEDEELDVDIGEEIEEPHAKTARSRKLEEDLRSFYEERKQRKGKR